MAALNKMQTPKRVVYTCLFGKYEILNEIKPSAEDQDISYICFTDDPDLRSESWKVVLISQKGLGTARESRGPKLRPHIYLRDFTESLYIDNTVRLKVSASDIFRRYLSDTKVSFACLRHPWRDCLYDEGEDVIRGSIDDEVRVREQLDAYRAAGHPIHSGLYAGTLLLRRHMDPKIISFGELWFEHVLRYSARDQISFPFCLTKANLHVHSLDEVLYDNPLFDWPAADRRIPYGFDDNVYLWLNRDVREAGMAARRHMFDFGYTENRTYRYHPPLELECLANKYRSDKGRLYYNRHFYTRIYEHYLTTLKEEQFTFVEIGLLRHDMQPVHQSETYDNAPSLFMWHEYFSHAQIHGIDIADFSAVKRDRITFSQADQSNPGQILAAFANCKYAVKVIVDDGSHASQHQQVTLGCLFPKLASGGIYFIEDLHYQPPQWEDMAAPKTRDLLRALQRGDLPETPFIAPEVMLYIKDSVADIQMFDSMDYALGANCADALAVIVKK
ncbi:glycosyltransferase domain-containing protein [Pararhizobium sp. DWP1-1-3]|uniref:glycosyltransferase domain-containing protein n=1 Tax=Pararhizobium sp. DWP1-1-3 TaxID=2804652 RepID=UPI003CEF4754